MKPGLIPPEAKGRCGAAGSRVAAEQSGAAVRRSGFGVRDGTVISHVHQRFRLRSGFRSRLAGPSLCLAARLGLGLGTRTPQPQTVPLFSRVAPHPHPPTSPLKPAAKLRYPGALPHTPACLSDAHPSPPTPHSQLGPDKDYKLVPNDKVLATGMKNMKVRTSGWGRGLSREGEEASGGPRGERSRRLEPGRSRRLGALAPDHSAALPWVYCWGLRSAGRPQGGF